MYNNQMYNKQSSLGGIHKFNSKGVMRNRFGEFLSLKKNLENKELLGNNSSKDSILNDNGNTR